MPDLGGPGRVKRGDCRSGPLCMKKPQSTGANSGLLRFLTRGTVMGRVLPITVERLNAPLRKVNQYGPEKKKPRDERGFIDRIVVGATWGIGKTRSCDLNLSASTLVPCDVS